MEWSKDITQPGYFFERDEHGDCDIIRAQTRRTGDFDLFFVGSELSMDETRMDIKGLEFLGPITPEMVADYSPGAGIQAKRSVLEWLQSVVNAVDDLKASCESMIAVVQDDLKG